MEAIARWPGKRCVHLSGQGTWDPESTVVEHSDASKVAMPVMC